VLKSVKLRATGPINLGRTTHCHARSTPSKAKRYLPAGLETRKVALTASASIVETANRP